MPKIVLELDMTEELAETAGKEGLLDPDKVVSLIKREAAIYKRSDYPDEELPPGYDKRLLGIVPPELYGRMTIMGDLDEPLDAEWDACK